MTQLRLCCKYAMCLCYVHGLQAMFVSFGMAQHRGGHCYLRFDDTNPEAEKQEYIDHIREIVSWMGWTPFKANPILDLVSQSNLSSFIAAWCTVLKGFVVVRDLVPDASCT